MKKIIALCFFMFGLVFESIALDIVDSLANVAEKLVVEEPGKKSIYAFMPFSSDEVQSEIDEYITDGLMEAAFNTGKIRIVERAKLNNILNELKLQSSGVIDENTAKEVGKIAGVDYVCYGYYSIVDDQLNIKAKVTDVQTGELCAFSSDYIETDDYLKVMTNNTATLNASSNKKSSDEENDGVNETKNAKSRKSVSLTQFYALYDIPVKDYADYYGLTFGLEKRKDVLVFGLSGGIYYPFNKSDETDVFEEKDLDAEKEMAHAFACLNLGLDFGVLHFKVAGGYALRKTEENISSPLVRGIAGIDLGKLRIDYVGEYYTEIKQNINKVSVGLVFKF
ncbi:MAG: hypothetical protein KBT11_00470 [Treponema sp.]|nr:hypothetical protein [Candidatus Treponema equifaecale]